MKKLTSIILSLTMLLSCAALVGCAWEDIFAGIWGTAQTTTTTTVTTANPDESPKELKITHGDNFTEEDIEFLKNLNNYQDRGISAQKRPISEVIDSVKNRKYMHLYFANVDVNDSVYICGYVNPDDKEAERDIAFMRINVERYAWYKYIDPESVPKEIDGLTLAWGLKVYKATITNDIGNGIDHERKIYFFNMRLGKVPIKERLYEYTIFGKSAEIDEMSCVNLYEVREFQGYTTTEGKSYLVLKYRNVMNKQGEIKDYLEENRQELGNYYDVLCPYFERIEEMDYEFVSASGEEKTYLFYGIPLDVMSEVLFQEGKDE